LPNNVYDNLFHMSITLAFTLPTEGEIDYVNLLKDLIDRSLKDGELPNRSEYLRKIIIREAKKAGLI